MDEDTNLSAERTWVPKVVEETPKLHLVNNIGEI